MPPVAAEFAVGDGLQPDRFLFCDCRTNAAVLDRPQRCHAELAAPRFRARLGEFGRAQEAADLVGFEGRFH